MNRQAAALLQLAKRFDTHMIDHSLRDISVETCAFCRIYDSITLIADPFERNELSRLFYGLGKELRKPIGGQS